MLRTFIPGILILTALLNMGLRLLSPDKIALRSWEAVTLFVTGAGPFAPQKHYSNPAATGDLGTLANLPLDRRSHSETFTTGPQGFRDYDPGLSPRPAAVLFGDSFAAGASLPDSDYLCRRLQPVFGGPVFFAGYYSPLVAAKLPGLPKTPYVILQVSERYGLNDARPGDPRSPAGLMKHLLTSGSRSYLALRYLHDLSQYSPLEIWAGRAYRSLQNDTVLPNPHTANVRRYALPDRSEMLFLASEVPQYLSPPPVKIESLIKVRQEIEATGAHVIVLIVPNKFTVYYPSLQNMDPGPRESELYVNVLERELRAAHVPVVNLTAALRRAAAAGFADSSLVYRADDTHWNASGVATAVAAIRESWPEISGAGSSARVR